MKLNRVAMRSTGREPFPSLLLGVTSLIAVMVLGCGPMDVREVASPSEAFLGRWLLDSDSRLVVENALMVEGGIDDDGLACANRYEYEVVDQSQEPFELKVKIRNLNGYEYPMTYEFSADRRKMRAKTGDRSWATHVDAAIVDHEFEHLEELLRQEPEAAE